MKAHSDYFPYLLNMLKGKLIYLRALEPEDINLLYEWENSAEVWKISDTLVPFSRFQLEQYIASEQDVYVQKQIRFVICLNSNNKAIGCIDLFDYNPNHRRVGLGILIAEEEFRKNGFGKESLELVVSYSFDVLDCINIYCNVTSDNHASLRLFESNGFTRVGEKLNWIREGKEFKNEILLQKQQPIL
ncbi:MAG: GNAT family N-acetyltransferase [Flavobacteriales bacterium]|nr:GNAT family N-acetyltransferase [Flavobacteriales bacterium]